jgi:hypothetical protein
MGKQIINSCRALVINHCISCHEDADMGYCDMCFIWNFKLDWEAEICCVVARALEGVDQFARALYATGDLTRY